MSLNAKWICGCPHMKNSVGVSFERCEEGMMNPDSYTDYQLSIWLKKSVYILL
jgi:hypothetical protein